MVLLTDNLGSDTAVRKKLESAVKNGVKAVHDLQSYWTSICTYIINGLIPRAISLSKMKNKTLLSHFIQLYRQASPP